jgi:ribonuclease HII
MINSSQAPDLKREQALWAGGVRWVAGVDEAGRGALAGPVIAGAVVLPPDANLAGIWTQVRDSKLLTAAERDKLERQIKSKVAAWALGVASADLVDRCGIVYATQKAMVAALGNLAIQAQHVLIDWVRLPTLATPQTSWAKADRDSVSVAAASILAKTGRDKILVAMDASYPGYGFAQHKGYGTQLHRNALAKYGPCEEHRFTFAPVAQYRSLFDSALMQGRSREEQDAGGKT